MVRARRRTKKRITRRKRIQRKRQHGGSAVPKVCIQTSKEPIKEYVVKQLKDKMSGWKYTYFSDADILQFFKEHPIEEFDKIADKFNSLSFGEHKADLFRYYYLYLNGGVFVDSDLTLQVKLDDIIGPNTFVSVKALQPLGSIFNGFIACAPKHPILYSALSKMYSTDNEQLKSDYTLVTKQLGDIIDINSGEGVKLLYEVENIDTQCTINDPDTKALAMIHYQGSDVPKL